MSAPPKRFVAQLSSLVPAGWSAKEQLTVVSADGEANVIASNEPVDPTIDTARYAEMQLDFLRREFPHYRQISVGEAPVLGAHTGVLHDFEWVPPNGRPLRQVQLYLVLEGRGYAATATSRVDQFERFDSVLRQVLAGLAFGREGEAVERRN